MRPNTVRMRLWLGVGVAAVAAVVVASASGGPSAGKITTFAGGGQSSVRDGMRATAARLYAPWAVAVDRQGNAYIVDYGIAKVFKVSRGGTITTLAGTGKISARGDGGPATMARLWRPEGVAVDGQGNVYIADYEDGSVRKVDPAGTITTFAGGGNCCLGDGGPATAAYLSVPADVAVDKKGNVFIAEGFRVRKVSPDGTITTFAGTGKSGYSGDGGPATKAKLSGLRGVAVDEKGNVYLAGDERVRKVSPGGRITTIAGGGSTYRDGVPATKAALTGVNGVAVDRRGNVYIAAYCNRRGPDSHDCVSKVNPGGTITTIAGSPCPESRCPLGDGGPGTKAHLYRPEGVAVDNKGNVYIADANTSRVRKVSKP